MNPEKHAVDTAAAVPVVARLLGRQAPSLSDWYGDPVSRDVAQVLAAIVEDELRSRLCAGENCFQLHVLLLTCNFRMGSNIGLDYQQLGASAANDRERALLELVYGQLLISCKCPQARQHLCSGFSLAVDYLDAADYFRLVRRHELLDYLPLSSRPSASHDLESLLTEAMVIKRLQTGAGRRHDYAHRDTVG